MRKQTNKQERRQQDKGNIKKDFNEVLKMFYIRDITTDLQTKKQDIYYYAKNRITKGTTGNGYKNPPTLKALQKYCDSLSYTIEATSTKYKYIMAFEHSKKYFHIVDIYEE